MFFCNQPIAVENPHIMDIAPTVLDLFGVPIPKHMDGKSMLRDLKRVEKAETRRNTVRDTAPEVASA
jgi:arylsulfatase A-like enzyme